MDMQKLIDLVGEASRHKRANEQMTLGELILTLEPLNKHLAIDGLKAECDSYRGYYSDLAFKPGESTVGELLQVAKAALNQTFEGYKGGDFVMGKNTPIWCAQYGCTGLRVMSLQINPKVKFILQE